MYINGNYFSLEINKKESDQVVNIAQNFLFLSLSSSYFSISCYRHENQHTFKEKKFDPLCKHLSSRLKTRVTARELRSEDKDSRKRLLVVPLCECPNIHFVLFSEAEKEDLHDLSPDMSITLRHERILKAIHWRDL